VAGIEVGDGDGALVFPLLAVLDSFCLLPCSVFSLSFSLSATAIASFSAAFSTVIAGGILTFWLGVGAVVADLVFLLFVLRAKIGATSSVGSFGVIMAAISASLASLSFFFCLLIFSFFPFLFVITGGGELARDADADVIEKASTRSLNGVPGWFMEVILGRLEACLLATAISGTGGGVVAGRAGGVSALGVSVIRKVRGWVVLLIGDPVDMVAAAGVPGCELIDEVVIDPARDVLVNGSVLAAEADVEMLGESSFLSMRLVSIFSIPGWGRLPPVDASLLGEAVLKDSDRSSSGTLLLATGFAAGSTRVCLGVASCLSCFLADF